MKKILFLFIIVLLFSCAPKKLITSTQTATSSSVHNNVQDATASQTNAQNTVVNQSNTDTETTIETTVYDTTKPNVPGTDKPPVKEVKKITKKKTDTGKVQVTSDVNTTQQITHNDSGTASNEATTNTLVKEIPKTPAVAYWFWIIIIVLVGIGSFLVYKNFGKIKAFVGLG